MHTECSAEPFGFEDFGHRRVVAAFDGGAVTSDAGGLLLRHTDRALGLIQRVAACFQDNREQDQVVHTLPALVGQRIVGIALGYEDVNDHDELRHDPVLALFADRLEPKRSDCAPLAGKSTLNRLEHAPLRPDDRYHKIGHDPAALANLFVDLFLEAHPRPLKQIVLDLDATDDPLHGQQEGRFFHGYYGCYCYLPLYVFCGRHLLAALLRPSNIAWPPERGWGPVPQPGGQAAGAVAEVARIVDRIRAAWPRVEIWLRADSGFARDELMAWCEANRVHYVFGLARNPRLVAELEADLAGAATAHAETGQPARRFEEFFYATLDSWSRARRVIGKAEHLAKGANPRFIVTSLPASAIDPKTLYEAVYCARGEMENRIKEQQLDLFADRLAAGLGNGAPTPFRRPIRRHHAGESAAVVVRVVRLRAARGPAPHRPAPHPLPGRSGVGAPLPNPTGQSGRHLWHLPGSQGRPPEVAPGAASDGNCSSSAQGSRSRCGGSRWRSPRPARIAPSSRSPSCGSRPGPARRAPAPLPELIAGLPPDPPLLPGGAQARPRAAPSGARHLPGGVAGRPDAPHAASRPATEPDRPNNCAPAASSCTHR
jgi:Transposase DDE domain group 1